MARRVVLVVFPDLQLLDLGGPLEVFAMADRFSDSEVSEYVTEVVSPDGGAIRASSGLEISANRAIGACRGPIDTLVVVGGRGVAQAIVDDRLVAWIRSAAQRSRRVTSVCSGAFLLARAGLLDGRRATTHWATCARLAQLFPEVTVDPDPIFIRDGNVWTSAGVTAGMDLALALVEDDLGPERAREIARYLVLFVQRSGGQSQFSAQLAAQRPERDTLVQLASWIADHLGDDLSVPVLAARTSMSVRNFSRRFAQEFGSTPAAYVEAVRVEAGRRLLETTRRGLTDIARDCGFGTVETMHRSFQRTVRITPGQYRQHFGPRTPAKEPEKRTSMRIVIPLFDRFTALDAVGPYQVLSEIPGAEVVFAAAQRGPVRSDTGTLAIVADASLQEVDDCEVLVVPGGPGTRRATTDETLLGWVRQVHTTTQWTTSVCTGALVLAAAGLLQGLEATTHWAAADELEAFGARYTTRRVVTEGKIVTAAGVSAGIDMALTLAARIAGDQVAEAIQLMIEYDPQPPFDNGSVAKSKPQTLTLSRSLLGKRSAAS